MSDEKKNEQAKPIKDETLDKVSGGVGLPTPPPIPPHHAPVPPIPPRIQPV
ncbi:MAG: hypothetical protein WB526_05195 [Candidatus Cybelea sp.]